MTPARRRHWRRVALFMTFAGVANAYLMVQNIVAKDYLFLVLNLPALLMCADAVRRIESRLKGAGKHED